MDKRFYTSREVFSSKTQLMKNKSFKIAFLGNSVTAQKTGYVHFIQEFFDSYNGKNNVYIKAGLGGIGSLGLCFVVEDFVCRHKPDICFVDCSIADMGLATPFQYIESAVSGIIEKLRQAEIQIYFLHLYRPDLIHSESIKVLNIYEKLAAQYSISSINIGKSIMDSLNNGFFSEKEILYDGIHTTEEGAKRYASEIYKAFCAIQEAKGVQYKQDKFLKINAFKNTQVVLPQYLLSDLSPKLQKARFKRLIKYINIVEDYKIQYQSQNGLILGFLLIVDEESGVLQVTHDNKTEYIQTSDEWCHKERIQAVILPEPIPLYHKIEISLSTREDGNKGANGTINTTKKTGKSFKLIGFLEVLNRESERTYSLW